MTKEFSPSPADVSWSGDQPIGKRVITVVGIVLVAGLVFLGGILTERFLLARIDSVSRPSGAGLSTGRDTAPGLTESAFAAMVLMETNDARTEAGLQPLAESDVLDDSATAKLEHLLRKDYWAHIAPDGSTPWDFIHQAGYQYDIAGENLARDYQTPHAVVDGWMHSPEHRENMLAPGYTEMGLGVRYLVAGDSGVVTGWTVVAHYAKPR